LWRVARFTTSQAEALQKHLAADFGTDRAATAAAQLTRLPGFVNYKYVPPPIVTLRVGSQEQIYTPSDFPVPTVVATTVPEPPTQRRRAAPRRTTFVERAPTWPACRPRSRDNTEMYERSASVAAWRVDSRSPTTRSSNC
jgi:hypothetical protein